MENNIKITFWLKRVKKNSKNLVPVYMRVTQNYDHFNKTTGIRIPAGDWDKKAMRIRGATPEVATANATLDSLKVTLDSYGTIIDKLMLRNVKELKEKLSSKNQQGTDSEKDRLLNAHHDLLFKINGSSKN
jgi:hypothetical protein